MSFTVTRNKIQERLSAMGNENMVVQEMYSPKDVTRTFVLRCQACGEIAKWEVTPELPDINVGFLESMCEIHKHKENEKTGPTVENPSAEWGSIKPYIQSGAKPNVNLKTTVGSSIPANATTDFGMMGDITFHGSSSRRVSVTQELLKWVAKLSNFNVDLQAFVQFGTNSDYRAICNQCKQFIKLPYECLINNESYDNNSQLGTFCKAHRHDGSELTPVPEGRKFRV